MSWLAQLCFESDGLHEGLVIGLLDRMPVRVPAAHDALHVVCQDILGDPHEIKSMDHSDEQVLLFCVGKEFHIPLAAVMANHGKAGAPVTASIHTVRLDKSPVHLVGFAGSRAVTPAAVPLRIHQHSFRRDKVLMVFDIYADLCLAAGITVLPQPLKADSRVCYIPAQQVIQEARIAGEDCHFRFHARTAMGLDDESVFLIAAQPAPGDPGAAFELRKVYYFNIELVTKFNLHLFNGLC